MKNKSGQRGRRNIRRWNGKTRWDERERGRERDVMEREEMVAKGRMHGM